MTLECKKTENCFSDAQTYEYRIPMTAAFFLECLDTSWNTRCNQKLRRPVFLAEKNGIHIKGILAGTTLRVSFPADGYEAKKKEFEDWMVKLLENL